MKFLNSIVVLALLLPVSGRRLGQQQQHKAGGGGVGGRMKRTRNMNHNFPMHQMTSNHQQTSESEQRIHKQKKRQHDGEEGDNGNQTKDRLGANPHAKHAKPGQQKPIPRDSTNCGTFLIRQASGLVIYDDFDKFENSAGDSLVCQHTQGQQEMCLGGDQDETLLVQGTCRRGIGRTSISLSNGDDEEETSLVFACEKSADAIPRAMCTCSPQGTDGTYSHCNGETDALFRAEARFGFITLKGKNMAARCALACKMPTTDE